MTKEQDDISKVFGDPFDTEPDERIKKSGGYTKIEDGKTIKIRFTMNLYRYYKFQPEGYKMPMRNNEARDLLDNQSIDDIFSDQTIKVSEGYCSIVWNYDTESAEVWQFSRTVFDMLKTLNKDTDWEGGLASNDIKVTRTGSGTDTKYSITYCKTSNEITKDMEQEILNTDVQRMVAGAQKL